MVAVDRSIVTAGIPGDREEALRRYLYVHRLGMEAKTIKELRNP